MDSPTDTLEMKQGIMDPKDEAGFHNAVTNLIGKLSRSFGFTNSPTKVYTVNWQDYSNESPIHSKDNLHVAPFGDDNSKSEKYTHEIIIHDEKQEKTAFSLLRTKSPEEAVTKIEQFSEIFPCLMECGIKDMYTTSMLQKVLDTATNWPSYKAAHVAVHLGLFEAFNHHTVKSSLEEPEGKRGSYPIHIAVESGNEKVISALLACGITLDVVDNMGNTPMHIAASKSTSVIEALLPIHMRWQDNPFVNSKNTLGESPFALAAEAEKYDNLKMLISLGANLNHDARTHADFQTEHHFEKRKRFAASKDFSAKDLKLGGTLLHWAKTREAVRLARDMGCRLNVLNKNKEMPLHVMVRTGRMQCAMMLLSSGADPNVVDKDGNTPLHLAARSLSVPMLQALISFGADVGATNNNKESARHIASTCAAVDQRSVTCREQAIYILHAVGASRCLNKLASCKQGCLIDGLSNGIALVAESPLQRSRWVFDEYLANNHVSEAIQKQDASAVRIGGRVLCLDGGGIKGLVLCQLLSVIEKFIGRPIHECFDWITGTSTGAFFALNLALGRPVEHTQGTYYRLKEQIFVGTRPYDCEPLETLLKDEFGLETTMDSITGVMVNLTTTLADRIPADLHIFRNYEAPIDILGLPQNDRFVIPPAANEQRIWEAARASGAAPTFFRLPDSYLDGGLIANNPVLDTLTEIEERNMALEAVGRMDEIFNPTVVLSIGCGKHPISQISTVDPGMPSWADVRKGVAGPYNMLLMLAEQVCSTEERTVDRARAWCSSRKIAYFRFNPNLSQSCALDEVNDEKLVNMMWEARTYMTSQSGLMSQLKKLLTPPHPQK